MAASPSVCRAPKWSEAVFTDSSVACRETAAGVRARRGSRRRVLSRPLGPPFLFAAPNMSDGDYFALKIWLRRSDSNRRFLRYERNEMPLLHSAIIVISIIGGKVETTKEPRRPPPFGRLCHWHPLGPPKKAKLVETGRIELPSRDVRERSVSTLKWLTSLPDATLEECRRLGGPEPSDYEGD